MPAKTRTPSTAYQLKITLVGISPPIWRRILVPSTIRLSSLNDAIQAVFGWTDTHLHHFEFDGGYWGVPADEDFEGLQDESKVPLRKLLIAEGWTLNYTYDFGDNWRHKILLEKILDIGTISRPICVDGRRHRPPEDVGGPSGYEEFLETTFDPGHEDSERFREWAGGEFHAEEFDVKAVNEILSRMRWPVGHRR
jgi:Plasmid pRiA4b ORF-3-like protein